LNELIKEAARYLGYKKGSDLSDIGTVLERMLIEIEDLSNPKYFFRILPLTDLKPKEIKGYEIVLPGKDINNHLHNSQMIAIMAVTLGMNVDKKIKELQYTDLSKAMIYDACASAFIEQICDRVEVEIVKYASQISLGKTSRFSPGYGDFPLEFQREIDIILNLSKNVGIFVSKSNILVPRKSVTAVIGLGKDQDAIHCTYCNKLCEMRKAEYRGYRN
jgi:hypothetical protein